MKLVDANVLLYAVNRDAERHVTSRAWLDGALSGDATVAFSWIALLAFVRLSTKPGLFPNPLSVDGALDRVHAWTSAGPAVIVEPTPDHVTVLRRLLSGTGLGIGGNIVNDAHLAALAIEHRCTVVSFDNDFSRFEGLNWEQPTA